MTAIAHRLSAALELTAPTRDLVPPTDGTVTPECRPTLRDAIVMLRRVETYRGLLDLSCGSAVRGCRLERALYSELDDRTWRPSSFNSRSRGAADRALLTWLGSGPVLELDAGSAEQTAISTGTVVQDVCSRVPTWLPSSVAGGPVPAQYLVAPILCEGRAVGLLHADLGGCPLCSADREALATFVEVLSLLLERATMRERLAVDGLRSDAPVHRQAGRPQSSSSGLLADLTARQLEVLAAMATGASNAEIAASLFVSTTTVKSHVRCILGTLQVPNRSSAIAHFLQHTMNGPTGVR